MADRRWARALASPVGVIVTLPLLVALVGVSILLFGRVATRTATRDMAQRQLADQTARIRADVALALDQASPMLERLRGLADAARPAEDVLVRLHDLAIGRPGVAYVSISYPDGTFRGAYLATDTAVPRIEVQESRVAPGGTNVSRFTVEGGALRPLRQEVTQYDPRTREFYTLAATAGARTWTPPYTFFKDHQTGITCAEPVYAAAPAGAVAGARGPLAAVLTVDFAVGALSSYVARAAADVRTIVYAGDGVVLAYPEAERRALPASDEKLRVSELHDPALAALVARPRPTGLELPELVAGGEPFLAAVAPVGGQRAGVNVPLDWYVASIVPARVLLGPTRALERQSLVASAIALAVAVALALVLAWNLLRMRRLVAASRAEARTAEAKVREMGSYRLVGKLGTGGMGEVWRAEHRLLARTAAIKLIRPEALADPGANSAEIRERFRREAQTLASMQSRHTIAIYDYGVTEDGTFYYVMELLDGLDFESLVLQFGPQPAARVIQLLVQACSSLAEAHDAGLLHRDIKPPNLFACRAADEVDIVKLLDFGIVHSVHDAPPAPAPGHPGLVSTGTAMTAGGSKLTSVGALVGTPGFMAKEQILGLPIDARADLYALGCVAWWLLCATEVFTRTGHDQQLFDQHLYATPPTLGTRMRGWCPPALETVIGACLAKEPEQRPRDAREIAAALRAIAIPPEHAWTEARAREWWATCRPAMPAVPERDPESPSRVQHQMRVMPVDTQ